MSGSQRRAESLSAPFLCNGIQKSELIWTVSLLRFIEEVVSVGRKVQVTALGGSVEGTQLLAKKSFRVQASEDDKIVVFEVRISLDTLETLPEPETWIAQHFKSRPLPRDKEVIDVQPV